MRVTVDLDTKSKPILRFFYKRMKGWKEFTTIKIFSTRRGFHFIMNGYKVSFRMALLIRAMLGDDTRRLLLDLERYPKSKIQQVLFTEKNGYKVEEWSKRKFEKWLGPNKKIVKKRRKR